MPRAASRSRTPCAARLASCASANAATQHGTLCPMSIWYGDNVADDGELRSVRRHRRQAGARAGRAPRRRTPSRRPLPGPKPSPSTRRRSEIARLRAAAEAAEVQGRVPQRRARRPRLRHQWLDRSGRSPRTPSPASTTCPGCCARCTECCKPSGPFVVAMHHPVAAMFDGADPTARRAYGTDGDQLRRAVHGVRAHQLPPRRDARARRRAMSATTATPSVLVVRARKQGN